MPPPPRRRLAKRLAWARHFRPIVGAGDHLIGLEALVRWRQPDESLVGPEDFVPVLEVTGLIVPVTYWIPREVCRQCRRLQEAPGSPI